MPSLNLECPHCGAERTGFNLEHETSNTLSSFHTLLICASCGEGIVAVFRRTGASSYNSPKGCPGDPRRHGWALANTYPKPQPSSCPSHTPEALKRLFLQATKALKREDPDASGAMSRKVVDVSSQQLLGEESEKYRNIQQRIDALAASGKLTIDLKDWAHQIRLGGNDAAHDLHPFTIEEADELIVFVELYLTYVYTLPGRLKERRERSGKDQAEQ